MEKETEQKNKDTKPLILKVDGKLPGGRKITPETLSIERFGHLFDRFKKIVAVATNESDETLKSVNFQYKHGSAIFLSDVPSAGYEIVQQEVRELGAGHPLNHQHSEIAAALVDFKKVATDLGEEIKITLGDERQNFIEITKDTEFEQLREVIVDSETIIYGKLYAVGGKKPNIHLAPEDGGETWIIYVTEDQAKEMAEMLYDVVGVKTAFKKDILNNNVLSADYMSSFKFSRTIDEEKFRRDKERGTRVWQGIDPVKWEQELRAGTT